MDSIRAILTASLPPLSAEEERALVIRAQQDPDLSAYEHAEEAAKEDIRAACDLLLRSRLGLVVQYAKAYARAFPGVDFDDFVQQGSVGVLRAIALFQPSRGTRLNTLAVPWIRQSMQIYARRGGDMHAVRIPRHMDEPFRRTERTHGLTASSTEEQWREAWAADGFAAQIPSLLAVLRLRRAREVPSCEVAYRSDTGTNLEVEDRDALERALSSCNTRCRQIVCDYFGVGCDTPSTLEEVGKRHGVCRERVRQVVEKALSQMREWARKEGLIECCSPIESTAKRSKSSSQTAA